MKTGPQPHSETQVRPGGSTSSFLKDPSGTETNSARAPGRCLDCGGGSGGGGASAGMSGSESLARLPQTPSGVPVLAPGFSGKEGGVLVGEARR